ncbi:hypothetical protein [Halopseudomonas pertucinogena]|nr:hypothetical protein [Halopseudomonas pertucinogena]
MENWKDVATVLSGFSTVVIAGLTLFLWRENRAMRKAGSEPRLIAYYEPHPDGTGGLNIAIANVGTGPARNVCFQFLGSPEDFSRYNLQLDCTLRRGPISMIPQGEKLSLFFAVGHQLFKSKAGEEKPIPPFNIKLEWSTLQSSRKISSIFPLDVSPYAGLPGFVNKPPLIKIVDSLDEVGKQIGALKPLVGKLTHIIETTTLESEWVSKTKGNTEDI